MARDKRWTFIPFLFFRAVQLLFAVVILGTSAYIVSLGSPTVWWAALGLSTSLLAILWIIATFVLYCMGRLLPLAAVIIDAFITVFLLTSMAGTASSGYVASSCQLVFTGYDFTYTTDTYWTPCLIVKASFAMELLSMFLFIGTLITGSIALHRTRKDLRGKKYNAGRPFVSGGSADAGTQMEGGTAMVEQGQYYNPDQQGNVLPMYTQQPQQAPFYQSDPQQVPIYQPPPQPQQAPFYQSAPQQVPIYQPPPQPQQPQPVYQQGPTYEGFVSPPASPAPHQQHQHQQVAMHSTGLSELSPARTPAPPGGVVKGNELPTQ